MAFADQFAHPTGWRGALAGRIMAFNNQGLAVWTLRVLQPGPKDRLLEIGFGPGVAIQRVLAQVPEGWVAGVDLSPVMVRQARRRNAAALRAGRLALQCASVHDLPFDEEVFDKVFAVNSFQFWPEPDVDLRGVYRCLKSGGRCALTVQPRWAKTTREVEQINYETVKTMEQAGFVVTCNQMKSLKPVPAFCIVGKKTHRIELRGP